MFEYNDITMNREKTSNLLNHPLLIVIYSCLCLLVIFSLRESSKKALVSKESIEKLEKNIDSLEKEVALEKEKLKDSQDDIAVEKIMHNELLLKKEGEIVLQIPEEKPSDQEKQDPQKEENGPWQEWQKLLK